MMKYEPFTVIKWIFLFGFMMFIPFSVSSFIKTDLTAIPVNIWLSVSYVIIAGTVIGYYLNNYSLRTMSPTVTGTYKYIQPVVAASVALIFGKDTLHLVEVIAALLIFAGVYFVSRSSNLKNETLINN
jgi:drug/metabolite transporter (DMT)-like permease